MFLRPKRARLVTGLAPTAIALFLALPPQRARAEEGPRTEIDSAERAREAFRDGLALLSAENWSGALARFRETARFRMTAQVAFNIAECEAHLGQLVAALGNYRLAYSKAMESDNAEEVARLATERIAGLEPRISRLAVTVGGASADPKAFVELDGIPLAPKQLGAELPVDPGQRVVRLMLDGRILATERIELGEGERKKVTLEAAANVVSGPRGADGPGVIPGALVTTFGGLSLVAGGVVIGLRQSAIDELDGVCTESNQCPESARATIDRGRLMTGFAEVLIPVGAVAVGTGIGLLVAVPTSQGEVALSLSAGPGGMVLTGQF